ncbi:MAG: hypothetical protein U1F09_12195 [Steroidobacteraceae bacterium]
MHQTISRAVGLTLAGCLLAGALPATAQAESSDDWQFAATIYGWLPSIDINSRYPSGGSSVTVSESDILDALQFTFMGGLDARKDRWGVATDLIYLDLSSTKKATREFNVDGLDLPAGVTAKATVGVTGWLWTTAGYYRAVDKPEYKLDLLAGARMLDLSSDLKWSLTGDLGDPPILARNGKSEVSQTIWDGIVGVRGRAYLGKDAKWFIPYYADVGTGDSDMTWQGMIGAGYSFDWGDVLAVYRYLDYNLPSKDAIESANFAGMALGVTFRF